VQNKNKNAKVYILNTTKYTDAPLYLDDE